MKNLTKTLFLMSFLAFSSTLFAQEHFAGTIDSCLDVFDGNVNGYTEYYHLGATSNNNIRRYYKVLFTHPGCDTTSYKEVFREDFDGSALDTIRWRTKDVCPPPFDTIGCGCPKNNAEVAEKRDKMWLPSNVTVDGGYLHLKTGEINPTLFYTCVNENGQTMTLDKRFSSAQVVSKNIFPNAFGGGCFKYGRITIRAKVPNNNNGKNTIGSIWFYRWAGEVDLIEVCKTECGEMQTNRHQWKQNPLETPCDGVDDNLEWAQDNTIAGGINVFHEYSMEWTPYNIIISVDGVVKRTFTRFSSITQEPIQGSDNGTTTVIHPLKCEEIPAGQTDTLWQHILWGDLSKDNLNLIMNVGIKDVGNYNKFGGEMLVDWVKVEQRIPATTVTRLNSPPGLLCVGQTTQFKATVAGNPTYPVSEWTTSSNLKIVSVSQNTQIVTVKAIGPAGPGWVQARLWNQYSCFGTNVRTNIEVGGMPVEPIVSAFKSCGKVSLKVNNPAPFTAYQWEIIYPLTGCTGVPVNNGLGYEITTPVYSVYIIYRVKAINACGETSTVYTVSNLPCNNLHIDVFPNPANSVVNFQLTNITQTELDQGLELTLVDANFNIKKTMPVSQFIETMDVSNISPSYHYAYIVVNGESVITGQFLIQH